MTIKQKYIVDTAEIYTEPFTEYKNGKPMPRKKHIFVEMDGFHFDSAESDSLVEFFQSIVDYEREG